MSYIIELAVRSNGLSFVLLCSSCWLPVFHTIRPSCLHIVKRADLCPFLHKSLAEADALSFSSETLYPSWFFVLFFMKPEQKLMPSPILLELFIRAVLISYSSWNFSRSWCPFPILLELFIRADFLIYSSFYRFWSCCHDPCAFWRNWCIVLFFVNGRPDVLSCSSGTLGPSCCPVCSVLHET